MLKITNIHLLCSKYVSFLYSKIVSLISFNVIGHMIRHILDKDFILLDIWTDAINNDQMSIE